MNSLSNSIILQKILAENKKDIDITPKITNIIDSEISVYQKIKKLNQMKMDLNQNIYNYIGYEKLLHFLENENEFIKKEKEKIKEEKHFKKWLKNKKDNQFKDNKHTNSNILGTNSVLYIKK